MRVISEEVIAGAVASLSADTEIFGPSGPCPLKVEPCGAAPKVILITGENASGKSLACKMLGIFISRQDIEVMPLGMSLRTEGGFQRAMVYGNEQHDSTGAMSLNAALTGMKNATGKTGPRLLVLDEPDIGLSESFAAALGLRIGAFCADVPPDCAGVVVVTHNRAIASVINDLGPWRIRVGPDLRSTADWICHGPRPVHPDAIEALFAGARERFLQITRMMDARREAARQERERAEKDAWRHVTETEEAYMATRRISGVGPEREDGERLLLEAAGNHLLARLNEKALEANFDEEFSLENGKLHFGGVEAYDVDFAIRRQNTRNGELSRVVFKIHGAGPPLAPINVAAVRDAWWGIREQLSKSGGRKMG